MTYILDLQRLWEGSINAPSVAQQASSSLQLDPRKNIVSVIMMAYPDEAKLQQTVQKVLAQQFVREIIIVNCEVSTQFEKSLSKFTTLYPKCYIVHGNKNLGLAAAYNLGAQYAASPYLLFLSANCLLSKNAVMKLLAAGIHKPMPWVIGTGKEHELMTFPEVSLAGGGYHTKAVAADCIFISTQTFLELRGMDKRCFHHTFHADLCMRIHLAGGGVYQVNDIRAVRKGAPQTSFRGNVRRAWQAFRGGCHYYRKYKSKNTNIITVGLLYFGLSLRLLGDIIKSIRMALTK